MTTWDEFDAKLDRMINDQAQIERDTEAAVKNLDRAEMQLCRRHLLTARELMRQALRSIKRDTSDSAIDKCALILTKLNKNIALVDFHLL